MAKSIIPIGKSLGPILDKKGNLKNCELAVGDELETLEFAEWAVWNLAHDDVDAHAELRFDRELLIAKVQGQNDQLNRIQIEEIIRKLKGIGALIEVDLKNPAEVREFLSRFVMVPTAVCNGSSPDDPELYRISDQGDGYADISGANMLIWVGSHREPSIWYGCEETAKTFPSWTADRVAAGFVNAMTMLVPMYFGYLEPIK